MVSSLDRGKSGILFHYILLQSYIYGLWGFCLIWFVSNIFFTTASKVVIRPLKHCLLLCGPLAV